MRAGRLIAMLLTLQQRGRMTAAQLADHLEVSPRTVLRDVEALGEAGLPIYTQQGAGGGIDLVGGFRGRLVEFTRDDAEGLLLAGQPALASALGLGAAAAAARQAVLAAVPDGLHETALTLDGWFLHDPIGRGVPAVSPTAVRRVARAVRERLMVQVTDSEVTAPAGPRRILLRPLGLVLERGRWQLVHLGETDDEPLVQPLDRLEPLSETARRFERPKAFDLARFWAGRPGESTSTPP